MPSARGPRVLVSLAGLAALWAGFGMAAAWYPAEYDWRYMTVSHLLTARDNPSGYLWASGGIVGCGVLGLIWTWLPGPSSAGHWLARAGILFMALFGLGTMPTMLAVSLSGRILPLSFRSKLRAAIPIGVCLLAMLLILRGLALGIPYLSPDLAGGTACCRLP